MFLTRLLTTTIFEAASAQLSRTPTGCLPCRRAAIVAAENVPGVKQVNDELFSYPPPEEDFGGGDFASLQEQPSTTDDAPL
jgi:hypothetical protein